PPIPGFSGSMSTASSQAPFACTSPPTSVWFYRPSACFAICFRQSSLPAGPSSIRRASSSTGRHRSAFQSYATSPPAWPACPPTALAWLAWESSPTPLLVATVRAEHQAFYRGVFGHRPIGEPRHYPSLAKPISLMALDYAMARERVPQRYPFFRSTFFERRM